MLFEIWSPDSLNSELIKVEILSLTRQSYDILNLPEQGHKTMSYIRER